MKVSRKRALFAVKFLLFVVLDFELINQQAENGTFESQRYAQYVLSVCSRLCCPARDEMIRKLTQTTDLISLFK